MEHTFLHSSSPQRERELDMWETRPRAGPSSRRVVSSAARITSSSSSSSSQPRRRRVKTSEESDVSGPDVIEILERPVSVRGKTRDYKDSDQTPRASKTQRRYPVDDGSPDPLLMTPKARPQKNMAAFNAVHARLQAEQGGPKVKAKISTDLASPRKRKRAVLQGIQANDDTPARPETNRLQSKWVRSAIQKIQNAPPTAEQLAEAEEERKSREEEERQDRKRAELSSAARAFFAQGSNVAVQRQSEVTARAARIASMPRPAPVLVEVDEMEVYCNEFRDFKNICPYCHEVMPKEVSPDLVRMRRAIKDDTNWRQTISYCTLHKAETHIIPLGQREGFPPTIDFLKVDKRLESGFVAERLRLVAAKPHLSIFFRRAQRDIEAMGLMRWKALDNQATDETLSATTPGYYGDLGQNIIARHFELLVKWNMLRSLSTSVIHPLSPTDFITCVLVPEAAVLLIMEDNGWSGGCRGPAWDAARKEAMVIRGKSEEYGHWKFRENSIEGERVRAVLKRQEGGKRERIEEAFLLHSDDDAASRIPPRSSQQTTDVPDSSEPEDEAFWAEAISRHEEMES